jgi:hypothetical protein
MYFHLDDSTYLADPSSFLLLGPTFGYPILNISDIMWRLSVEKDDAGVIGETCVTNPLFVYDNEIRFYNITDTSSVFFNSSTNLAIQLEKAYLRDACIDEWDKSIAYSIYPDPSNIVDYIMESSGGIKYGFNGYVTLIPDSSGLLQYAVDSNYNVPLLSMNNFKYTDASYINRNFDHTYYLDIIDGKISMDAGIAADTSENLTLYLNFQYDTSLIEQMITVNAVYDSPRMSLFQIDPSIYYWSDPSGLTGADVNSYVYDNSIYTAHINYTGDYVIELFAWDGYNTMFNNTAKDSYKVWIKHPTMYFLVDNSMYMGYDVSTSLPKSAVMSIINSNLKPIYDRYIPLQGLSVKTDKDGSTYVEVPSITYWQDLPEVNSINKFYNLTERVTDMSSPNLTVDPDYQKFYTGDFIKIVQFNTYNYALDIETSANITNASGNILTLDTFPTFTMDSSHKIYVINATERSTLNAANVNNQLVLDVSGYVFDNNQVVAIIIEGISGIYDNYTWAASYKVISVDGSTHTFNYTLPNMFLDPSIFNIKVKHAFTTYSDFQAITEYADEKNNTFQIYLTDSFCQEKYLDNTFTYMNIPFDHDKINNAWYDPSMNMVFGPFYYYTDSIFVDISTLVILRAEYNDSNYLLNQKNIWTANYSNGDTYFKVYNDSVPIIFSSSDNFTIKVESYDIYGNLIKTE